MKRISAPISLTLVLLVFATPSQSIDTGSNHFRDWPAGSTPDEVGRRVAANFAARKFTFQTGERDFIFFAETCAWHNALRFARLIGDTDLQQSLVAKYDILFTQAGDKMIRRDDHVDYCCFGAVPLAIYALTKDAKFLQIGLSFANRQWENPSPEGLTHQARYWIDDVYAVGIIQGEAYRATSDRKYLDHAAILTVAYLDKLQQANGLFFHAPDSRFYWGRGNGWFAAGMAMLLQELPSDHPNRARLLLGYRTMMAALLKYQRVDGLWRQLIDHPDFWPETSGTGLFTFAMAAGVTHGWIDANTYGPAARKAWLGMVKCLDAEANVRGVCDGTNTAAKMVGLDPKTQLEYYRARQRPVGHLHGITALLLSASALMP